MSQTKPTTTIALDIGSVTGFAISSPHGISYGKLNLKHKGKFVDRGFAMLYDWLTEVTLFAFEGGNEVEIVVECPHAGRFFAATKILFGLLAVVHLFGTRQNVKVTEVKPTAIKKFATGSGAAKKDEMVKAVQKIYPNVTDNNTADAIHLLRMHLNKRC